jgi:predicted nucleic acid-binding protein
MARHLKVEVLTNDRRLAGVVEKAERELDLANQGKCKK